MVCIISSHHSHEMGITNSNWVMSLFFKVFWVIYGAEEFRQSLRLLNSLSRYSRCEVSWTLLHDPIEELVFRTLYRLTSLLVREPSLEPQFL